MHHDPSALLAAHAALSGVRTDLPPDERDYVWKDRPELVLPPAIDHSHLWVQVDDQLHTGSCEAQTLTSVLAAVRAAHHLPPPVGAVGADVPSAQGSVGERVPLSRLQLYRHAADLLPSTAGKDAGTNARCVLKVALRTGVAPESVYPFVEGKVLDPIPPEVDAAGAGNKVSAYVRLRDMGEDMEFGAFLRRVKEALATGHTPLLAWALTADYFGLGRDAPHNYLGTMKAGADVVGYHAQAVVGYYSVGVMDYLVLANSWGTGWGAACGPWLGGFAHVPAYTVYNDSLDLWAVTAFEGIDVEGDFGVRRTVAQLYVALFGRAADAEGMRFWVSRLGFVGVPVEQVVEEMFATDPARAYYPAGAVSRDIVASFYRNTLGREADAEGLEYWANELDFDGPGKTIARLVDVVGQYHGTDPAGVASAAYFNGRARRSQVWAESGGGVEGSAQALL